MLSDSDPETTSSRSSLRGGEAPMEIDSPPPLCFVDESSFAFAQATTPLTTKTPQVSLASKPQQQQLYSDTPSASSMASPKLQEPSSAASMASSIHSSACSSSPSTPGSLAPLQMSSPSLSLPSPGNNFHSPSTAVKSPRPASLHSTPAKSPLRSCHTHGNSNNNNNNNDAVFQLRRLTTAAFPTSPQAFYSPLSSFSSSVSRVQRSPLTRSASKRSSSLLLRDPTKVAAAAALVSSSTTAWHLHLPIILMNYIQLFFNTLVGVGVLYLIFSATTTVLHDAQLKVDERLQVMMAEIALCSRQYVDNRCSPDLRVPAMEKACMEWETCMLRDPSTTSRARLHAETIAEILNGFFGAISTRTFLFMIGGATLLLTLFNAAFYFGRTSSSTQSIKQ